MKKISISVPKPCNEKWENFTPTQRGGFCSSCQKEVIDFTSWSEERLKAYFRNFKAHASCGRFRQNQLTEYTLDRQSSSYPQWFKVAVVSVAILLSSKQMIAQTKGKVGVPLEVRETYPQGETKKEPLESIQVSGLVLDETGTAVPGVYVMRKGTSEQTLTDVEGKYTMVLTKPEIHDTLVFAFIGFTTIEKRLNSNNPEQFVNIDLVPDVRGLGSVEVVAGGVIAHEGSFPRRLWWKIKNIFR